MLNYVKINRLSVHEMCQGLEKDIADMRKNNLERNLLTLKRWKEISEYCKKTDQKERLVKYVDTILNGIGDID